MPVIELTLPELRHLQNDLISYIWKIKKIVFGDKWNFGTDITEVDQLTPKQEQKLKELGYYSRVELLNKLNAFEKIYFPGCECCG